MERNSVGEESRHVIQIWEVNRDRLANMQQKITDAKNSLQSKSSAHSSCCIFRASRSLIDSNGRATYQPQLASIGPYHHGEPRLSQIEDHKWSYLASLLDRTQDKGLRLEDYLKAIHPLEIKARECYSETTPLSTDEFVELLVLDGCFLIELFRKVGRVIPIHINDPLFSMHSMLNSLFSDLIQLENQIPFFILRQLFDMSIMPGEEHGLTQLALEFFNYAILRPDETILRHSNLEGRHLLDILRSSFLPEQPQEPKMCSIYKPAGFIKYVSKLRLAGIKFRPGKSDSFLTVKFRDGALEMPTIAVDDFMRCFITNCIAFEQYQRDCSKHFTTYATFLDCLINTSKDVEFLSDCNVVENYIGSDAEVAKFVNKWGKDVAFDIDECYMSELFEEVNGYYENDWHVARTSFRNQYFGSPWSGISVVTGSILLFLTVTQTLYAMLAYHRPT